jgi:hypothetical protein
MLAPLLAILSFLRGAIRRLPIETAIVLTAAATTIHMVHASDEHLWHPRLLLSALIAGPLVFSLHERERTRRYATAAGAAITAGVTLVVALSLPSLSALEDSAVLWTIALVVPAAYLVPFIVAAPRFFTLVRRFFEELTTWSLLAAVSTIAVAIVCFSIEELFGLSSKKAAADLSLLLLAGFVLVAVERLLPDRHAAGKIPELWRRLATAIGAPFVSVMMAILVVYEISVAVRGELPQNLLSPLLLGAGFVGYLCTLIITAVAAEPVGSGALSPADPHRFLRDRSVRLARAFPVVLLALLPMALWAVSVRIEQYGLTPFRVVRFTALLCLVVLSFLGAVRWLRGQPPLGWHVPAVIAAFALAISAGPLGAVNLSVRSQAHRLDRLLDDAGLEHPHVEPAPAASAESQKPAPPSPPKLTLSHAQWRELTSTLDTLVELGGEPALRRIITGDLTLCASRWREEECLRSLGLGPSGEPERFEAVAAVAAVQYDTRVLEAEVHIPAGRMTFVTAHRHEQIVDDTLRLPCSFDGSPGQATLSLAELLSAEHGARAPLPARIFPLHGQTCANPGALVIHVLELQTDDTGRHVRRLEGAWVRY